MNTPSLITVTACLVVLSVLALPPPAQATSLGQTTLGKLVSGADLIVVGRVARVIDIPAGEVGGTVRVAEVDVVE